MKTVTLPMTGINVYHSDCGRFSSCSMSITDKFETLFGKWAINDIPTDSLTSFVNRGDFPEGVKELQRRKDKRNERES